MASLHRGLLPKGYFAEIQLHIGGVEVDVATLENMESATTFEEGNGGVAVAVQAPVTTFTMPAVFPDSIEVHIFETSAGPTLVGAIEFVSPGNKDRASKRRLFAAKCAAYLARGVGLICLDIVTSHHFNLHNELIELLGAGNPFAMLSGNHYSFKDLDSFFITFFNFLVYAHNITGSDIRHFF